MTGQKPDMTGKICLVTGATSGLGEVTARELAGMNANVILVSRNPKKCELTVQDIKATTHNPNVEFLAADLSSQKEVQRVAAEFKSRYQRLDVLVNNAGGVFLNRTLSADGIEMTFALNHLSYFLLTNLLLDVLVASAPSRVVNVSSAVHLRARLDMENLQNKVGFNGLSAYSQSKLANMLFTFELARRLEGTGVTVNALHPGYVESNLGKNNAGFLKPLAKLIHIGGIPPEEGARTIVYLASSPEVEGITGSYFVKQKVVPSLVSYDKQSASQLWEISAALTGVEWPLKS
jgi:NAD(P)-dependent dehydrogenase (short-subunit alcohol dehydrogenase family)